MIIKGKFFKLLMVFVILSALILSLGITPLFAAENTKIQEFVTRFYVNALERQPDTEGLSSWINQLASKKVTGAQFAQSIIFSAEFSAKNKSNEEFVAVLFRTCYNREPDAAGYENWVNILNSGQTRQFVLAGFTNSAEFVNICNSAGIKPGQLDLGAALPAIQLSKTRIPILAMHGVEVAPSGKYELEATRRLNEFDADARDIPTRQMLIWPEIKEMSKYGIEFQSHMWGHEIVTDIDGDAIQQSLMQSKSDIEVKPGKPCVFVAWPHDAVSGEAISLLGPSGYRGALRAYGGVEDLSTINLNNVLRLNIDATINPVDYSSYIGLQQ